MLLPARANFPVQACGIKYIPTPQGLVPSYRLPLRSFKSLLSFFTRMFSPFTSSTRAHSFIFVVPPLVVDLPPMFYMSPVPVAVSIYKCTCISQIFWDSFIVFLEDCTAATNLLLFPINELNPSRSSNARSQSSPLSLGTPPYHQFTNKRLALAEPIFR